MKPVGKKLRLGEFLLAMEGLALARNLYRGTDSDTNARFTDVREILGAMNDPDAIENLALDTAELGAHEGYEQWAAIYDAMENPLIVFEQRALEPVLRALPVGTALDVCTGTGRVASILNSLGHQVVGIDQSAAMLALAEAKVPGANFRCTTLGDPLAADVAPDFDLATCSLALTHFEDLATAIANIAKRVRPGGQVVITDVHPFFTTIDTQAFFNAEEGSTPWVRNHPHFFSDYLDAFRRADLDVLICQEPTLGEGDGPLHGPLAMLRPAAARNAFLGLPFIILWVLRKRES